MFTEEANEEFRAEFHSLISLAFVPEQDVKAVFQSIVESASNEMIPVYDHLEDIRTGETDWKRTKGTHVPPKTVELP